MSALSFAREGADWPLREASRFVEAGGLRWHVQALGEGTPALLLHGTAGATHSWRGVAPLLAPDFQIVAPDLPGHGFTTARHALDLSLGGMARAVAALLAKLEFSPRLVVGHSAGAPILAKMIADGDLAPDLFVAINGAFLPFPGLAGHVFPTLAKVLRLNPLVAWLFAWNADRARVDSLLKSMGSKIDAQGLELYTRLLGNPGHCAGALGMMANWDLTEMPSDLRRIACPALLLVGAEDLAVAPDVAKRAARSLPRSTIEILPNLGHLAHEEDPAAVAGAIRRAAATVGLA